jgi:hypothetical protein
LIASPTRPSAQDEVGVNVAKVLTSNVQAMFTQRTVSSRRGYAIDFKCYVHPPSATQTCSAPSPGAATTL